ncbi:MAG: CHAD domain-containing protein [Proteobacteria bacterium]|nr:CHAD domain-containing protein [Pseudomonadota bacterium]MBU4326654.1 CHAD domain-containing protein [Pseudomonadota bacterium]MBU4583966.1 CHAD domain-containing protein [Pseudomonadota bacterium]
MTDFSGENIIEAKGPVRNKLFPLDFANGVLGEKLQSVAGIRALLPLVEITRQSQTFQIVNRDQKVVLFGSLELNQLANSEGEPTFLAGSLRVRGVRGYDKILTRVMALLQRQGLEAGYPEERTLRLALASMGRKPLAYRSQFSIILDQDEAVIQAARKIFLQLLDGMERNVPGIIQDIDTEFLHDFRVALRRTRSLLGSIKKMLPSADVDHFQRGLQEIGIATGPVRDLDVYLLGKKGYQAMLPEGLQEGLAVFFQELSRQRVQELRRMKKALQSRNCKQFLMRWRRCVEDSLIASALEAGHEPCKEVAIKAISKRLQSILKGGAKISPQSPDGALHSLRIQAKKLRYLLEFYRSLFPEPAMNSLVKSLKKLQDNLGNFNDLSVQQGMLGQHQKGLAGGEQKKAVQVAAALGGLITHLHEEQKGVRQEFELRFKQFTTTDNRRLFDLFL